MAANLDLMKKLFDELKQGPGNSLDSYLIGNIPPEKNGKLISALEKFGKILPIRVQEIVGSLVGGYAFFKALAEETCDFKTMDEVARDYGVHIHESVVGQVCNRLTFGEQSYYPYFGTIRIPFNEPDQPTNIEWQPDGSLTESKGRAINDLKKIRRINPEVFIEDIVNYINMQEKNPNPEERGIPHYYHHYYPLFYAMGRVLMLSGIMDHKRWKKASCEREREYFSEEYSKGSWQSKSKKYLKLEQELNSMALPAYGFSALIVLEAKKKLEIPGLVTFTHSVSDDMISANFDEEFASRTLFMRKNYGKPASTKSNKT